MSSRMEEAAGSPQTVDEAREAVERSRERISSTLDALEGRIVDKKHELQDKADVLRPVRERVVARPFTAVAVGLGVGALLGSLGGGDDEADVQRSRSGRERGRLIEDDDRRELREWRRARRERLRAVARQGGSEDRPGRSGRPDRDEADSRFDGLKHQLMGAVTTAITAAVTSRMREFARDNISSLTGGGRHDSRNERIPDDRYDRDSNR
jgi:ElaB/YqjD/DUF883 family membrane-anchored ribosome-binding protein